MSKLDASATTRQPLVSVRHLTKHFPIHKGLFNRRVGEVKAVDDVSFDVFPNETVGLVGESGCGKTTTGRTLLRLIEPSSGEVLFKGQDIVKLNAEQLRQARRHLQIIFQDPYSSLNPRMTVEGIIGEAIEFHGIARGKERRAIVEDLLERVGLQPSYITRYPHEFSGGQRQRLGIARALALNPDFIVCDEAVSALDVSVQAQVINLLQDLQQEFNLSYLFIAHDLSVVRHISDRIAVMYLGQVAELAPCDDLFDDPLHPYTQALLSAIPQADPRRKQKRVILAGDVPSPINPPSGCRFHTRCPACYSPCKTIEPRTVEAEPGHFVRCHLYDPEHKPTDPSIFAKMPLPPEERARRKAAHDQALAKDAQAKQAAQTPAPDDRSDDQPDDDQPLGAEAPTAQADTAQDQPADTSASATLSAAPDAAPDAGEATTTQPKAAPSHAHHDAPEDDAPEDDARAGGSPKE